MNPYVHPEVLVTTEWAANNTNNPKVRIVEVDVDSYPIAHATTVRRIDILPGLKFGDSQPLRGWLVGAASESRWTSTP